LYLTLDVPEIDASSLKVDIQEQKITIDAKSPAKNVHVELNLHGKVKAEVRPFVCARLLCPLSLSSPFLCLFQWLTWNVLCASLPCALNLPICIGLASVLGREGWSARKVD